MRTHQFQLIDGSFTKEEALGILTKMVDIKIKFHEEKIHVSSSEEDIKMRENRIKQLQKDFFHLRQHIEKQSGRISFRCEINF